MSRPLWLEGRLVVNKALGRSGHEREDIRMDLGKTGRLRIGVSEHGNEP